MRLVPLLILLAVIAAVLYSPIELPWQITSIGQVFPRKAWKIVQDGTGNLLINEQDFRTGETSVSSNYQFERGDLVQANLRPGQDSLSPVKRGDTVLVIRTVKIEDRLTTLRGQLAEARGRLASAEIGSKQQLVEAAENQLRFSEQEFSNQQTTYSRQAQLFQEKVVSAQEVENAKNTLEKARIQIEIDRKALDDARTGLKPADVEIVKSQISNLVGQISFLEKQATKYVLAAPFDGVRRRSMLPGEVFTLHTAGEYFLQIPVKITDLKWVNPSSKITVSDVQTGKIWPAKFVGFAPQVDVISGQRANMMEVSVSLPPGEQLSTGLSVNCLVDCGAVNVREYLRRVLNF